MFGPAPAARRLAANVDTVAVGEPHVEQDCVWLEPLALGDCLLAGRGLSDHEVAAILKQARS